MTETIMKTSLLEAETALYERELPRLLKEGKSGKFVVIGDGRIIGTYGSYEEALNAGYTELGEKNFLVKQIEVVEKVHFFTRDIDSPCHGLTDASHHYRHFRRGSYHRLSVGVSAAHAKLFLLRKQHVPVPVKLRGLSTLERALRASIPMR